MNSPAMQGIHLVITSEQFRSDFIQSRDFFSRKKPGHEQVAMCVKLFVLLLSPAHLWFLQHPAGQVGV